LKLPSCIIKKTCGRKMYGFAHQFHFNYCPLDFGRDALAARRSSDRRVLFLSDFGGYSALDKDCQRPEVAPFHQRLRRPVYPAARSALVVEAGFFILYPAPHRFYRLRTLPVRVSCRPVILDHATASYPRCCPSNSDLRTGLHSLLSHPPRTRLYPQTLRDRR
jgi:hypothetical protein